MAFENELMQKQEDLVGHTLEYYKNDVDKLYIWIESKQKSFSFNAFALKNGEILYTNCVSREDFTARDFLAEAVGYIRREYKLLREEYGNSVPSETKLVYDFNKNSLEATYLYDGVDGYSEDTSLGPYETLMSWEEEIKKELGV